MCHSLGNRSAYDALLQQDRIYLFEVGYRTYIDLMVNCLLLIVSFTVFIILFKVKRTIKAIRLINAPTGIVVFVQFL